MNIANLLNSPYVPFFIMASALLIFMWINSLLNRGFTIKTPWFELNPPKEMVIQTDKNGSLFHFIQASHKLYYVKDGNLGYNLFLGGELDTSNLHVLATKWQSWNGTGQIRSGWLYLKKSESSAAVAFFKLHLHPDMSGYIHIADVCSPSHIIWFRSPHETHQNTFCYKPISQQMPNGFGQTYRVYDCWSFKANPNNQAK